MKTTQELYFAYCDGDTFTDEEVILGEQHFTNLANILYQSGPAFVIPAKDAQRTAMGFRGFRQARGLKDPK